MPGQNYLKIGVMFEWMAGPRIVDFGKNSRYFQHYQYLGLEGVQGLGLEWC